MFCFNACAATMKKTIYYHCRYALFEITKQPPQNSQGTGEKYSQSKKLHFKKFIVQAFLQSQHFQLLKILKWNEKKTFATRYSKIEPNTKSKFWFIGLAEVTKLLLAQIQNSTIRICTKWIQNWNWKRILCTNNSTLGCIQ